MRTTCMFVIILLFSLLHTAESYDCSVCYGDMCCNIPGNSVYFLTDFCGGAGTTACGYGCQALTYFTADKQRFGCNSYLHICAVGKCLKAKVIDAGPADWVERDAGGPIIDASVPVCKYFTGHTSCGWSDHFKITAVKTQVQNELLELGPVFNLTEEEYRKIVSQEQLEFDKAWFAKNANNNNDKPVAAPKCCSPSQWEGYRFSWDERAHFRAGQNITYDWTNKRTRIVIEERFGPEKRRILESLALYDKEVHYLIDWTTNHCHVEKLPSQMVQDCVPAEATLASSITIGLNLKANVWATHFDNGTTTYDIRTANECMPIDNAEFHNRVEGGDLNFYWDLTLGIKNTTIFDVPSICNSAVSKPINHPRVLEIRHILDELQHGHMWKKNRK